MLTKYHKKISIIILIIICGLAFFILHLNLNKEHAQVDDSIKVLTEELGKEGFEVRLKEYPKSRSEIFSYSKLPTLLLIDNEEIFVFQYSSPQRVIDNIKLTNDSDAELTFYSDYNIFLYRGDNEIIIKLLKNKLNALEINNY